MWLLLEHVTETPEVPSTYRRHLANILSQVTTLFTTCQDYFCCVQHGFKTHLDTGGTGQILYIVTGNNLYLPPLGQLLLCTTWVRTILLLFLLAFLISDYVHKYSGFSPTPSTSRCGERQYSAGRLKMPFPHRITMQSTKYVPAINQLHTFARY